jgi:multiple sugar transport system ATP-binding protein
MAVEGAMPDVELDQVTSIYRDGTVALAGLCLRVRDGEVFTVVGPSGCGKTTLLRVIAGLEAAADGRIRIGGRDITHVRPSQRDVAMVFEGDALYPHLTAAGNLRFGLEVRGTPPAEIDQRVGAESRVLGLWSLLHRRPATMSAGERQRVAVGRATVRKPSVFLLDEPLAHLDPVERRRLHRELALLIRGMGVTTILVTHDQEQAMAMADRVGVMRGGRLEQVGEPSELYMRPATTFVASWLGDPPMSLLSARLEVGDDGTWIVLGHHRLRLRGTPSGSFRARVGEQVVVGARPEHVTPADSSAGAATRAGISIELKADAVQRRGADQLLICAVEGTGTLVARAPNRTTVKAGDKIELVVDTAHLSFFDPASGAVLWHGP